MSATAQKTRPPQQQMGNWATIFPPEQVTEQQSALFVKKLLAVAVSNITYLRAIFPENAFGDRCLEDLNLKILRDDSSCPGACQVIKWVKGCFDALDKKYLRMLIIGIYTDPEEPDTVIESYTFKFSYEQNGGIDIYRNNKRIASAFTAAETKKATIRLLRTIIVLTQSLSSLPDDVMMTMKLLYYDDITPSEYEPPGFTAAETDNFNFEEEPMNIKVGDVETPFHTVKLRIKTDGKQFTQADDAPMKDATEAEEPLNTSQTISNEGLDAEEEQTQTDPVDDQSSQQSESQKKGRSSKKSTPAGNQVVPEPAEGDVPSGDTPSKPGVTEEAVDTTGSQLGSQTPNSHASQEDLGVRCPCGYNEDDGLMVLCANCKFWQHGVCFMILSEDEAPARHICDMCANQSDETLQPTDSRLCGQSEVSVQATCLWRRSLMACREMTRVLLPNFVRRLGVEMAVGQGLMNRLLKEGFLKNPSKGKKLGKIVDQTKLKEGIAKYFKKDEQQEVKNDELKEKEVSAMEVEVEIVDKKDQNKPKKRSKDVDMEIEKLASRAEDISLAGRSKRPGRKANEEVDARDVEVPEPPIERGRGKKRVKAMADESQQFELNMSQDVSQDIDYGSSRGQRKQRKASVVRKAIVV